MPTELPKLSALTYCRGIRSNLRYLILNDFIINAKYEPNLLLVKAGE